MTLSSCALLQSSFMSALTEDAVDDWDHVPQRQDSATSTEYGFCPEDELLDEVLPTLLQPRRLARAKTQQMPMYIKVKNTFIDGFAEDESDDDHEDSGPMMGRRRTCPDKIQDAGAGGGWQDFDKYSIIESLRSGGMPELRSPLKVRFADPGHMGDMDSPSADIAPLEIRQPEMSMGSREHASGECRPCAWFWRPQGCSNGVDCRHCHRCPPGELKARRKSNRVASQKSVVTHRRSTILTAESDHPPALSPAALSHVPSSSVSASDKEPYPVPTSSAVQFSA